MTRTDRNYARSVGHLLWLIIIMGALLALQGCSSVKHVPQGQYLLDKTSIKVNGSDEIAPGELYNYLRQTPNHKVLGFAKLQLATYSLSGRDSTRWWNRWIRRLGQPPVILNNDLTEASLHQLHQAMINRGYLDATVDVDTTLNPKKRKATVTYTINTGKPHRIASINYDIADTALRPIILADSLRFPFRTGQLLNRDILNEGRGIIADRLRNRGYYGFGKEHVSFIADTVEGSKNVDLTVVVGLPLRQTADKVDTLSHHSVYRLRNIYYVTDYRPGAGYTAQSHERDTVAYGLNSYFIYGPDHYLTPAALYAKSFLISGELYSSRNINRTYESINRLKILKSITIEMAPAGSLKTPSGSVELLDAYVMLSRTKTQNIQLEVEGTNSEGDLGFGIGVSYEHRNISKASNTLTAKARINYEALSGNLTGLINNRYTEYAGEVGLTFPRFMLPLLSSGYKRKIKASSELALSFNYQERPEYTRIIAGAGWKYKWATTDNRERRTFDLIDVNYVYLPRSTLNFIDEIAPDNPLLRYSYEDHFIMRMAYTFSRTNRRIPSATNRRQLFQSIVYSIRLSGETAGNLLYALSSIMHQKRDHGMYDIFGIAYSQYAKAEIDYAVTRNIDMRHSVAFHVGAGIGVPYGNSRVLPFEKRFYAGGANGVRGWGVRTLGPGSYDAHNNVTDFINQCGDIRLDLSAEYRMKLFWVIEGALFIDAGNIWTIHNYENQPGGMFHFNRFWKEIALAYGIGARLDFEYFLLRLDLGMKAHNPAQGQQPWPLIHPRWHRDATIHFSVGYPF